MIKHKKIRVFLGPREIAGMMQRLNTAFHELDIQSDFYCLKDYVFQNGKTGSGSVFVEKYKSHVSKKSLTNNVYRRGFYEALINIDIIGLFFCSLMKYNAYIYIFGESLFSFSNILKKRQELEFKILHLFKKKAIMLLCGSDSRAPYCGAGAYSDNVDYVYNETQRIASRIRMMEKYLVLVDNPASSHFHNKPYVMFNWVGIPIDQNECVKRAPKSDNRVTILHAPSHQLAKGTHRIREVIEEIRKEGVDLDYIEISGLPHAEVLQALRCADIVVDELYSDTPMAGLDTEASMNGVPVITCGYFSEYYKSLIPEPFPPTIYCMPNELKDKLIWLINSKSVREEIGQKEYEFVRDNWISTRVAQRIISIFDGSFPKLYLFDPPKNNYIWGWGCEKSRVASCVAELVGKYGMDALCLDPDTILYKEYERIVSETK